MLNILDKIEVAYIVIAIQILILLVLSIYKNFSMVFLICIALAISLSFVLVFIVLNNFRKNSNELKNFKMHYYILYIVEVAIIIVVPYFFNV